MEAMSILSQSLEQRENALERANAIRLGRATLKAELRVLPSIEARCRVADLLHRPPKFLLTMKLEHLLLAIPTFGDVKVGLILGAAQASSRKRVGGLSPRQREAVSAVLRRGL